MADHPAEHFDLSDVGITGVSGISGVALRRHRPTDAAAIAECVRRNLSHLAPWMPWAADDSSAHEDFQRGRLTEGDGRWDRGEEFGYVLVDASDAVIGATSLMSRRGPGVLEIGYWTDAANGGRGYGRALARVLTGAAFTVDAIEGCAIHCDEANSRSAAIPRALGYTLISVTEQPVTAPGESGRDMDWLMTRADWLDGQGSR